MVTALPPAISASRGSRRADISHRSGTASKSTPEADSASRTPSFTLRGTTRA